jgi:hypothetical protein
MIDVSTLALNMTFLMTLGIGLLMFLTHVLVFTIMLMLAGAARLAVLTFTAIWEIMMPHGKALPRETPLSATSVPALMGAGRRSSPSDGRPLSHSAPKVLG